MVAVANSLTIGGGSTVELGAGAQLKLGTGPVTIMSGGTLTLFGGLFPRTAAVIDNGTFDIAPLSANLTIGDLSGSGTVNLGEDQLTVGTANSTTFTGTINDFGNMGSLVKQGTGTLTLTGANAYSGGTFFNGGILAVNSDANLGTGLLTFNGGTLEALASGGGLVSGKAITLNAGGGTFLADGGTTSTLSGVISGVGSFTKDGPGTLTLTAANTYSGGTNLNGGILAVKGDTNLGTGPLSFNGGTLEALASGGGLTSSKAVSLAAAGGTFLADAGTASTLSGVISGPGALTKAGPGTLTLTGRNTYTGGTIISSGTLALAGGGRLAPTGVVVDNFIFDISQGGNQTIGDLSGSGIVDLGKNQLTVGTANSTTFTGTISDGGPGGGTGGSLVKQGTGTLTLNPITGNNAYSGGTFFNGGILAVNGDANLGTGPLTFNGGALEALASGGGLISGKAITLNSGGGTFLADGGTTSTLSGVISGIGSFIKDGPGTLTLTAASTYTGATTVAAGSLLVEGSIASPLTTVDMGGLLGGHGLLGGSLVNSGIVSPGGSIGTLTVAGNYTQSAGGTLRIEVAGVAPGAHDLLVVHGHASLAGTLQLIPVGGFQLHVGDRITFLTAAGGVSGPLVPSKMNSPLS
jgi:fibronectin-binding autotransporter adhesin